MSEHTPKDDAHNLPDYLQEENPGEDSLAPTQPEQSEQPEQPEQPVATPNTVEQPEENGALPLDSTPDEADANMNTAGDNEAQAVIPSWPSVTAATEQTAPAASPDWNPEAQTQAWNAAFAPVSKPQVEANVEAGAQTTWAAASFQPEDGAISHPLPAAETFAEASNTFAAQNTAGAQNTVVAQPAEALATPAENDFTAPAPPADFAAPTTPAAPETSAIPGEAKQFYSNAGENLTDLESTVIRRQSLLGGTSNAEVPAAGETTVQWQPRPETPLGVNPVGAAPVDQNYVLEGASVTPAPISRVGAHIASLFLTLIFVPVAWISLAHAGGMFFLHGEESSWATNTYSVEGLVFAFIGLVSIIVVGILARYSSLGAFFSGILITLGSVSPVIIPTIVKGFIMPFTTQLQDSDYIPLQNLGYYLERDLASATLLAIGVSLIMLGVVSHSARRKGRADFKASQALAQAQNMAQNLANTNSSI